MSARTFLPLVSAALALSLAAGSAQAMDDDARRAELCAQAQERYAGLDIDKPPSGDGHAVVLLYKYNFCPATLTVKKGTTVHFLNVDKRTSHSVWFKDAGHEESERFFPDEGVSMPMDTVGTFPYLCGPHWEQEGMVAQVTVTE